MIVDIFSGATENFLELGKIVRVNHAQYAARHNYGLYNPIWRMQDLDTVPGIGCLLPPSWKKIWPLKQWLHNNLPAVEKRYALWVDADAVFTNMDMPLDEFIVGNLDKELVVACDENGPNFGVFILSNTFAGVAFLNDIFELRAKYYQHAWFEQAAAHELLSRPDYPLHVGRLPWRTLQSSKDWQEGDFIFHTAGGGSQEQRIDRITKVLTTGIC